MNCSTKLPHYEQQQGSRDDVGGGQNQRKLTAAALLRLAVPLHEGADYSDERLASGTEELRETRDCCDPDGPRDYNRVHSHSFQNAGGNKPCMKDVTSSRTNTSN